MPMKILNATQLAFRFLLTTLGAFALLYALSYPYSIIAPNAEWDYVEELSAEHMSRGFQAMLATAATPLCLLVPWFKPPVAEGLTPEAFIPWLGIVPWLLMEIASGLGSKRNLVWFGSIAFVLVATFIAWPVLRATHPEYIRPDVLWDDGKLVEGVIRFGIFIFFSLLFRLVILDFLFRRQREPEEDNVNYAEADVLDPSKARTVKEIVEDPGKVTPTFLYGKADTGLIARFRAMMDKIGRKKLRTTIGILSTVVVLLLWCLLYPQPTEEEAFQRDMDAMYEQSPVRGRNGIILATPRAVHAAYRVFSHLSDKDCKISFIGKDDADVAAFLQLDKAGPAYSRQLRSNCAVPDPHAVYMPDTEDRFITFSDGNRAVTLLLHHDATGKISNVETQYSGWNPRADYKSWKNLQSMRSRMRYMTTAPSTPFFRHARLPLPLPHSFS